MVKIKEEAHILADGSIDLNIWLQHLNERHHYADLYLIRNACILSQLSGQEQATESGESCLQQGLAMAEILVDLALDQESIAAAIIYNSVQYSELSIDDIYEQLGDGVGKLVVGVERMNAIHLIRDFDPATNRQQLDNCRKMLLAMADDVRVVLIKLAEHLRVLRTVRHLSDSIKRRVAQETLQLYAPLANRLGIGQIKWEMEDLAFRYLQSDTYKTIAKNLKARRVDRDRYVIHIVETLNQAIAQTGIKNAKVYGRSKHIHSIYHKMQRKNIDFSQIYDATAVRVLTDNIEDCYQVLSIVHHRWQQIPGEFDDYIAHPKANGYRSLHTAVIGPEDKHFEVQIRTYQMHDEAELGVAAHWRYKEESKLQQSSHERKIEWLRQVLAWQKEWAAAEGIPKDIEAEFLEDRIYVFTPDGDIVDLPQGSTPIDFAYHVHSEVGHRCRGAKVDGHIIPLNHPLKTGEQIEILTTKEAKPSRDWLNPHLGYLKSSRAKAKIHHWFKLQNYSKNRAEGLTIMEREIHKLNLSPPDLNQLARKFNFKKGNDLLAALGRGDISAKQVVHKFAPIETAAPIKKLVKTPKLVSTSAGDVNIKGVGNLLTYIAKCCQPIPGDLIIGYITQGRGIAIHRKDCQNILHATEHQQKRFIEVDWGEKTTSHYPINIHIQAYDRQGLLRDLTSVLTSEDTNVYKLNSHIDKKLHRAYVELSIEINNLASLSQLLDKIKQLPNIIEARRAV